MSAIYVSNNELVKNLDVGDVWSYVSPDGTEKDVLIVASTETRAVAYILKNGNTKTDNFIRIGSMNFVSIGEIMNIRHDRFRTFKKNVRDDEIKLVLQETCKLFGGVLPGVEEVDEEETAEENMGVNSAPPRIRKCKRVAPAAD